MIVESRLPVRVHEPIPKVGARPLKAARMLAVAHRLQELFATQAEMADAIGCTQPRVSQLLDLTRLAPDLQEELVFTEELPGTACVTERKLRTVLRHVDWAEQRKAWRALVRARPAH